ncbi:peptidylprolyl isomerase [candidate division BRC1 bacterium HGW-BRC1-1]|jgi:peptidyl-prolyl cis-trans isomerase A (cyclophilin A)|nr:MAG: peptidylprolyl isomerase [candidate division BRC1 bacterium HGW-BRC1-1]
MKLLITTLTAALAVCFAAAATAAEIQPIELAPGKYAAFHTTEGDFAARLFAEDAPATVENFIGLATGRKSWTHPVTLARLEKPIYDNTTIYETLPNLLIRGGDPINRGSGHPGFTLPLETTAKIDFTTVGLLAMETSGPTGNGCRWFITLSPMPDLNGKQSIFGQIVGGLEVVREISNKPTRRPRIPLEPVLLTSVEIFEVEPGTRAQASFSQENDRSVMSVIRLTPPPPVSPPPAPITHEIISVDEMTSETSSSL